MMKRKYEASYLAHKKIHRSNAVSYRQFTNRLHKGRGRLTAINTPKNEQKNNKVKKYNNVKSVLQKESFEEVKRMVNGVALLVAIDILLSIFILLSCM